MAPIGRDGEVTGSPRALVAIRLGRLGFDVLLGDSVFVVPELTFDQLPAGRPVIVVTNFTAELEARLASPRRTP